MASRKLLEVVLVPVGVVEEGGEGGWMGLDEVRERGGCAQIRYTEGGREGERGKSNEKGQDD